MVKSGPTESESDCRTLEGRKDKNLRRNRCFDPECANLLGFTSVYRKRGFASERHWFVLENNAENSSFPPNSGGRNDRKSPKQRNLALKVP